MNPQSWFDGMLPKDDEAHKSVRDALNQIAEKCERDLAEEFYLYGPDHLEQKITALGGDFRKIYDNLIYRQKILKRITTAYLDFFADLIRKQGPNAVRELFKITDSSYDEVFGEIFDVVAISTGALFDYIVCRRHELEGYVQDNSAYDLRRQLGLNAAKYDELWLEILGNLLDGFCEKYDDDRTLEQGITTFTAMFNGLREQRSLRSFAKIWQYAK